jgi:hypothetical protein
MLKLTIYLNLLLIQILYFFLYLSPFLKKKKNIFIIIIKKKKLNILFLNSLVYIIFILLNSLNPIPNQNPLLSKFSNHSLTSSAPHLPFFSITNIDPTAISIINKAPYL